MPRLKSGLEPGLAHTGDIQQDAQDQEVEDLLFAALIVVGMKAAFRLLCHQFSLAYCVKLFVYHGLPHQVVFQV